MGKRPFKLESGMPKSRVFGGVRYSYWFHADTKREAEREANNLRAGGNYWVRVAKTKRGYNVYTKAK